MAVVWPNLAVQGTLRDKAVRSAPDLERWKLSLETNNATHHHLASYGLLSFCSSRINNR